MNRVAADLSWYQKLKRRLALRHNDWHEYQDGLCCQVEFKDGDLRYRHGDWCDCGTATQRREVAHRRRVDAGGYVPVTELGPPPQGEPAFAPDRLSRRIRRDRPIRQQHGARHPQHRARPSVAPLFPQPSDAALIRAASNLGHGAGVPGRRVAAYRGGVALDIRARGIDTPGPEANLGYISQRY